MYLLKINSIKIEFDVLQSIYCLITIGLEIIIDYEILEDILCYKKFLVSNLSAVLIIQFARSYENPTANFLRSIWQFP